MRHLDEVLRLVKAKAREVERAGARLELFPSDQAEQALATLYAELALLQAEALIGLEQVSEAASA